MKLEKVQQVERINLRHAPIGMCAAGFRRYVCQIDWVERLNREAIKSAQEFGRIRDQTLLDPRHDAQRLDIEQRPAPIRPIGVRAAVRFEGLAWLLMCGQPFSGLGRRHSGMQCADGRTGGDDRRQ